MNFPTKTGSGRVFMNGAVHQITWHPDNQISYVTIVTLQSGAQVEVEDYEDRFDYIYRASDDGKTFYNVMVLLDDGEPDPAMPSERELQAAAKTGIQPLFEKVMNQEVHADDLAFCRNLFTIPACLLRTYQKHGSVEAAYAAILRDVWYVG